MQVFELALIGFDGSSSNTDHLIIWVAAQASQAEFIQQLSSAGLYPTKVTSVEVLPTDFEAELQISDNLDQLANLIDSKLGTGHLESPIGKAIAALQLACQNPGDPNFQVYKDALTSLVTARWRILRLEKRVADREICPGGDQYSELLGLVGLYMPPSERLVRLAADARILGLDPQLVGSAAGGKALRPFDVLIVDAEGGVVPQDAGASGVDQIGTPPLDVKAGDAPTPIRSGDSDEAVEQSSASGNGPFVRDRVDMAIWEELAPAVANLEEDSVVGRAVIDLLTRMETLIKAQTTMEDYNVEQLKQVGVDQCHVWFYG